MKWSEFSFVLEPSPLGGIGVFATHDIPANTLLFRNDHNLRKLQVKDLPEPCRKYCIYISEDECYGPERFDRMEIGWYINHSPNPNIGKKQQISLEEAVKNVEARKVYALRDIKAGDEIFMNYNELGEPEYIKEDYYRPQK